MFTFLAINLIVLCQCNAHELRRVQEDFGAGPAESGVPGGQMASCIFLVP